MCLNTVKGNLTRLKRERSVVRNRLRQCCRKHCVEIKNAQIEFEVKFESRVTVTFDLKKLIEGSRNKKKWLKIAQLLLLIALLCLLRRCGWIVFMVQ